MESMSSPWLMGPSWPHVMTLSKAPPCPNTSACPPAKATGNYIALDIGNNHIAFYEHLQNQEVSA